MRYKTATDAFKDATFQSKEASILATDVCGDAGGTASAFATGDKTYYYTGTESSGTTNFAS